MIHPPKQDESQITLQANPGDSSFRRVALKQKPEEIEALIQERLPGVIDQFQKKNMGEVCQYMLPLQGLMEALMRGDKDEAKSYLSQVPE